LHKKKILIIGPIVDFGGREVMTNLLAKSLKIVYDINVLSTVGMSADSEAILGLQPNEWSTVSSEIENSNLYLAITSSLTKRLNKRKEPSHFFIKNKLTERIFNFDKLYREVIEKGVLQSDIIIYSDEINGKWLSHIIASCRTYQTPLLFRLTGKIKTIPRELKSQEQFFNVLSHSSQNAEELNETLHTRIWNIDQTTANEESLIHVNIRENRPLVYGFLGRFSNEKGILQVLKVFKECKKELIIAGNGPLLESVKSASVEDHYITYLGELKSNQISSFFNKIDVFIIPSFEEGGPIVGVEAMAAGKLIISTRVGAMPERMDGTGNDFWFSHEVQGDFLNCIKRLESLTSESRLKIRHQVRDKYLKNNSLKYIKKRYLEIISNMIKDNVQS
jgi:glycosyltransferase involved in cell wall biosynthesis